MITSDAVRLLQNVAQYIEEGRGGWIANANVAVAIRRLILKIQEQDDQRLVDNGKINELNQKVQAVDEERAAQLRRAVAAEERERSVVDRLSMVLEQECAHTYLDAAVKLLGADRPIRDLLAAAQWMYRTDSEMEVGE